MYSCLVDYSKALPRRRAHYFDPDGCKTSDEVAGLFGGDADRLQALCMTHFQMGMFLNKRCYSSPLLSMEEAMAARAVGETVGPAYRRLCEKFPMAYAKQQFAKKAWAAEERRLRDGIDIIAKKHGFRVVFSKNYPDRFDFESLKDGVWNRVGAISCM